MWGWTEDARSERGGGGGERGTDLYCTRSPEVGSRTSDFSPYFRRPLWYVFLAFWHVALNLNPKQGRGKCAQNLRCPGTATLSVRTTPQKRMREYE